MLVDGGGPSSKSLLILTSNLGQHSSVLAGQSVTVMELFAMWVHSMGLYMYINLKYIDAYRKFSNKHTVC